MAFEKHRPGRLAVPDEQPPGHSGATGVPDQLVLDGRMVAYEPGWLPPDAREVGRAAADGRAARTFMVPGHAGQLWIHTGIGLAEPAGVPGVPVQVAGQPGEVVDRGPLHTIWWLWREGVTGTVTVAGPGWDEVALLVAESFVPIRPIPVGVPFEVPGCKSRSMDGECRADGTVTWTAVAGLGEVDVVLTAGRDWLRADSDQVLTVGGRPAWYGPLEGAEFPAIGTGPRVLAIDLGGGVQLALVVLDARVGPDLAGLIRLAEQIQAQVRSVSPDVNWIGAALR